MQGSKDLNPHELAHRWVEDLLARPEQSVGIKIGAFDLDISIK